MQLGMNSHGLNQIGRINACMGHYCSDRGATGHALLQASLMAGMPQFETVDLMSVSKSLQASYLVPGILDSVLIQRQDLVDVVLCSQAALWIDGSKAGRTRVCVARVLGGQAGGQLQGKYGARNGIGQRMHAVKQKSSD